MYNPRKIINSRRNPMLTQQLFEQALHIQAPWFIKDIEFEANSKRLDIHIDFHKRINVSLRVQRRKHHWRL